MALAVLAGCLPSGSGGATDQRARTSVALLEGRVSVVAPSGYCVDETSLRDRARSSFVLIAGCDGLMGLPSGTLVPPAVLTVSALISDEGTPQASDMLAALDPADILSRAQQGEILLVQVDNADLVPQGSPSRHWRGAMVVNGVLLTMAAYGEQASGSRGQTLLSTLASQTRQATSRSGQE